MTPLRSVLLGFVILAAGARSAAAECGAPAWHGTPGGVGIPPTGVLYHYDSRVGEEARPEQYDAADATEMVRVDEWYTQRYKIDHAWQPPREAPRVLAMQRSKYQWSCSDQDALAIQLDQPVAAVRVFWATPDGTNEMTIAPRATTTPSGQPASVLLLGKLDCTGENVPVADLERGVVLGLKAIRHDGSEVTVSGLPTITDLDDVPKTGRVSPLGFGRIDDDAVAVTVPAAPWRPRSHGAVPIALVLGAVVFGARRGFASAASRVVLPKARARRG